MSLKEKFTGTGIAIVTPFHADGKIDWESFGKLIEFWIKGKVEYLVIRMMYWNHLINLI
jgi:4-hydroxy-tetrahydrodipicolinate synthase